MMPFPEQGGKLKWLESNLICCVMVTPGGWRRGTCAVFATVKLRDCMLPDWHHF